MKFIVFAAAYTMTLGSSWALGQVAQKKSVNDYLHEERSSVEMKASEATVLYQPAHEGQLQIEASQQNQVFLDDDLGGAPEFSEKTGLDPRFQTPDPVVRNPRGEVYDQVYSSWKKKKDWENYRQALSDQFKENLKKAGLTPKRNLANELELLQLELKQEN